MDSFTQKIEQFTIGIVSALSPSTPRLKRLPRPNSKMATTIATTVTPTEQEAVYINYLRDKIALINQQNWSIQRIRTLTEVFNYLSTLPHTFFTRFPRLKKAIVDKCWEMTVGYFHEIDLRDAATNLLRVLGEPFAPSEYKEHYDKMCLLSDVLRKHGVYYFKADTMEDYRCWCSYQKFPKKFNRYQKMVAFAKEYATEEEYRNYRLDRWLDDGWGYNR
jgi:hypothetical protein